MAQIQQQQIQLDAGEALEWPLSGRYVRFVKATYPCKVTIDGTGSVDALSGRTFYSNRPEGFRHMTLVNGAEAQTITVIYGDDAVNDDRQSGEVEAIITNTAENPAYVDSVCRGPNGDIIRANAMPEKFGCTDLSVPTGVLTGLTVASVAPNHVTSVLVQNLSTGTIRIGNSAMTAANNRGIHIPVGGSAILPGADAVYCFHSQGVAADVAITRTWWVEE